jgi:hypothetical protein
VRDEKEFSAHAAMFLAIAGAFALTVAIFVVDAATPAFVIGPDRPGMWYEWQLLEPSVASRASAWIGYTLHQLTFWWLIWTAQHSGLTYTRGLKTINLYAFGASVFFIGLHLVQTRYWYDGLAQDVPEWTSQWSVILLLLCVILIENRRRGIAFGRPWGGFVSDATGIVRKYHGYYFAWATIYTFWYHPMIATSGHLVGFLYMFLLFAQGSLMFTRAHLNRWWTATLEVLVIVHAVMVAIMNVDGAWPMFAFGLSGVFVVTQAWGLGLPRFANMLLIAAWAAIVTLAYAQIGWGEFPKILRILGGYYIALPLLAALVLVGATAWRRLARVAH